MARLFTSGFELNSTTAGVEFTSVSGTAPTIQSSVVRSGGYAMEAGAAGIREVDHQFSATDVNGPYYARIYLYIDTAFTTDRPIIGFFFTNDAAIAYIRLNTDNTLSLHPNSGTQIGSSSSALNTGQWYQIELYYKNGAGTDDGEFEGKIDGVSFASTTGHPDDFGVAKLKIGNLFGGSGGTIYIDDIALNDDTGSFQNSYPGEGSIIHLKPNATGDNGDWSGDYQDIDEVTPDDGTTKLSSLTGSDIEDVNLEASGLTSEEISVVQVGVRAAGGGASGNSSFVVRVKDDTGGTVEESSAITPSGTSYFTNATSVPRKAPLTLYDLPGASTTEWTPSELDTAQIGVRLSSGDTNPALVSTLWMLVEYQASAAGDLSASVSDTATAGEDLNAAIAHQVPINPDNTQKRGVKIVG